MSILPLSTSTASEKFKTILLFSAIPTESSAGEELLKVGAVVSPVVKEREVVSLIPA